MKKLFLVAVFGYLSVLACSSENPSEGAIENLSKSSASTVLELDWDEVPDFEEMELSTLFSIENLQQDFTRTPTLNLEASVIFFPVTVNGYNDYDGSGLESSILIARRKPKVGCKSCVDCIGFRCKDKNKPKPVLFLSVEDVASKLALRENGQISSVDRVQDYFVILNENSQMLEFYFTNSVEWNSLESLN